VISASILRSSALIRRRRELFGLGARGRFSNIRHTVRYTELSPVRFKGLWKD